MMVTGATLYVSDLDGTIIHDGRLSDRTAELLNSVTRRGVLLTYATARSWTSARRLLAGVDLRLPLILHDGAVTLDPFSGKTLGARILQQDSVRWIIDSAVQAGTCPMVHVFADREITAWSDEIEDRHVRAFWAGRGNDPRRTPVPSHDLLPVENVVGVAILGERQKLLQLRRELTGRTRDVVEISLRSPAVWAEGWWLEVTAPGVSKGAAVRELADRLRTGRVASFGDDLNDLSMFAVSDECYAVGSASDEVRAAATGYLAAGPDVVACWLADRAVSALD